MLHIRQAFSLNLPICYSSLFVPNIQYSNLCWNQISLLSNIVLKHKKNIPLHCLLLCLHHGSIGFYICYHHSYCLTYYICFYTPFFTLLRKINDWIYMVFQAIYFHEPILLKFFNGISYFKIIKKIFYFEVIHVFNLILT